MHRTPRRIAATLLAACATGWPLPALAQDPAPDLGWLEGHWMSGEDGPVVEEYWSDGAGGLMLGLNRTRVSGRAVAFEYLRIEIAGESARYCAQPGGQPATCFTLTDLGATHARFENPDHDFPQVITYTRRGDQLTAEISDLAGEQTMAFTWWLQPD